MLGVGVELRRRGVANKCGRTMQPAQTGEWESLAGPALVN
jgi:hypothetical protein